MTDSILPSDLLEDLAALSDSEPELEKRAKSSEISSLTSSILLSSPSFHSILSSLSCPPNHSKFDSECNELLLSIESELLLLHKTLKDLFFPVFPELEDILPSLSDYTNAVKILLNPSFTTKSLEQTLGNTSTIAIATALIRSPLSLPSDPSQIQALTEQISELVISKARLLNHIQQKIRQKAPNLCNLLSEPVAANLLSTAGGLEALSQMPACNIQVLGLHKSTLPGLSDLHKFQSYLYYSPFVMAAGQHKTKAARMLAGKAALAARVDQFSQDPSGESGRTFLLQIQNSFEKSLEVDLSKLKKPLAAPSEGKKTTRGGKRIRASKKRFEVTEVRKEMNRMQFGVEAQDEFRDSGFAFGMLGKSGKVKIKASKNKHKVSGKAIGKNEGNLSCFAFVDGNEVNLENPEKIRDTRCKYFESTSGFDTVLAGKK